MTQVTTLQLQNFRSYTKQSFAFAPATTVIVGPNASGKSNIIEALYYLATAGSFRTDSDRDALAWETEVGRITAAVTTAGEARTLELILTAGVVQGKKTRIKQYRVNDVARRMIDFAGNFPVTLFWPEDLYLVTGSPSRRRRYLDGVLIQLDREYRRSLRSYERGVRQRNRVLAAIKANRAKPGQLLFWNQLLVRTGSYITQKRAEFVAFINARQWIDDAEHQFRITYDYSIISEGRLAQYADAEIATETTLIGPHRDDIVFEIQKPKSPIRNLDSFGSRGEQRLGTLWLKQAELAFVADVCGEQPVLLLDDVLSELDEVHRGIILQLADQQQTIITSADLGDISAQQRKRMRVIELP